MVNAINTHYQVIMLNSRGKNKKRKIQKNQLLEPKLREIIPNNGNKSKIGTDLSVFFEEKNISDTAVVKSPHFYKAFTLFKVDSLEVTTLAIK